MNSVPETTSFINICRARTGEVTPVNKHVRRLITAVAAIALPLGALSLMSAPSANAELQHPRQAFLRASTGGLFLHWGERTGPSHSSCTAWENDVTSGGWNANKWVKAAQQLHVQYIVLATFHSRLGYARPWPSNIPGSCSTKRDFLGELIDAASKVTVAPGFKMRVILYMTDDPQWHAEGGHEWLNSGAFSKYAGHSVSLSGRPGFGEFSYDNFIEVMNRYPTLGGFWIDNENDYWKSHGLYAKIRQMRPNYTLSNNNTDTPAFDMISNEQKTGMSPSYDMPQKIYTARPRLVEADYKLPSTGPWWFTSGDPKVDRKLSIGRFIANAGSTILSLEDETAKVNGDFPPQQASFNSFVDGWFEKIWESLGNTYGGGYDQGGLKPGRWNNGAYGVTTVSKSNPETNYIHLIDPPSGSTLVLRDNGYKVTKVTNLRSGANVSFSQGGGNLTLTGLGGFDAYDTVYKVETSGRVGVYDQDSSNVKVTSSTAAAGHPGSAAGDGSYLTYWDNGGKLSASLTFDIGKSGRVQYLGVNQREDSVVSGGGSHRIKGYSVAFSTNGTTWNTVKTGTLANARGVQIIDVPAGNTQFVRLTITSLQSGSRIRVDEAWLGSAYPS